MKGSRGATVLVAICLLAKIASAQGARSGNPVLAGWYADPEVHVFGGQYWIYPTYSAPYGQQTFMDAFSSRDLINWQKHPAIIDTSGVKWARRALWAPSIIEKDGWYYLFFGANDIQNDSQPGGIGVARSREPGGPFKDYLGHPLIDRFHNGAQPIDQNVFRDRDGSYYIVYGGWRHCNIARLNADFTGFVPFADGSTFKEITPSGYVEGAYMLRKDGKYYFMWSEGGWTGPNYAVAYAVGSSPVGPFERIGKILQQDSTVATGAGHHSVLHSPTSNKWYIVYHRRPLSETDRNHRVVSIDELQFEQDGSIRPVKITSAGVAADPLATAAARMQPVKGDAEQRSQGTKPPATLVASFDGLGIGFEGPQGPGRSGNPSDNSLAVGPNHIVQTVNSRMAIFTKKGKLFDTTGKVLYGSVPTNNVFRGFTGTCEARNNGDAVVRYDQLADRWLIVMPIFSRGAPRPDQPTAHTPRDGARLSVPGVAGQPGPASPLYQPPPPDPAPPTPPGPGRGRGGGGGPPQPAGPQGVYSMCYAISTGSDPFGPYYRYEFLRPLFPDYPRPAIWPDGYYVPTSTGDNRISDSVASQMHACVVDRAKMLAGKPATEQCVIVENVNFLNNADIDGKALPPAGAPNIMMAAGGRQLDSLFADSVINVWRFHVDWKDPSKTKVSAPERIPVAPYNYLCNGQLSNCVPQPGTNRRLDSQGDKIMSRLVYRRIGNRESIVGTHSVNTSAGGGGVRWYEFRVGANRSVSLYQQGTYAPDSLFRWMASPAMDRLGNIGIGYSFGGLPHYAGQRFAGRLASDPRGQLTLRETVLATGEGSQTNTYRWQDYTQSAVDPSDDCTIWYVGDYFKKDAMSYSTRIGAFRMPGCR